MVYCIVSARRGKYVPQYFIFHESLLLVFCPISQSCRLPNHILGRFQNLLCTCVRVYVCVHTCVCMYMCACRYPQVYPPGTPGVNTESSEKTVGLNSYQMRNKKFVRSRISEIKPGHKNTTVCMQISFQTSLNHYSLDLYLSGTVLSLRVSGY